MLKILSKPLIILPSIFLLLTAEINAEKLTIKDEISIKSLIKRNILYFQDIPQLVVDNNLELKELKELITSNSFNVSSKISKKYPRLDLQANGLPQYLYGKNFNSDSIDTKTSQIKFNPSLNIRWDIIDPQRGPEIKLAKNRFDIAKNNYEIKKNDLIQEANLRFHKLQKASEETNNAMITVELSQKSLQDAELKLKAGIGTKFDVLEANAQLARDKQSLEEKKIDKEINLISLKEILNINIEDDLEINSEQKLMGFWNYSLKDNLENGIKNSLSLRNINLQNLIKINQAKSFINATKPLIFISNNLSSSFSKGSALKTNINSNESSSNYSNTLSLNFAWNIFNGGQNKNSYKSKQAEANSEIYKYSKISNIIKVNISETFLTLKKNQKKLLSTQKEIIASKESLRLARLRYDAGISTLKDVLIRQKELSDAKSKNISAVYHYNINLDKLERLTFQKKDSECLNNNKNQNNSFCSY